jgi:hypothetical protein
MLRSFARLRGFAAHGGRNWFNTKSRLLWLSRCSLLVCCQVVRWFTARGPTQTRTGPLQCAMPPADNSTGFLCLYALSSFQRTDSPSGAADRHSRSALPRVARLGTKADRFWGNLLRLLQRTGRVKATRQPHQKSFLRDKKSSVQFLGATSGILSRVSPTERLFHRLNTRARGGFLEPFRLP